MAWRGRAGTGALSFSSTPSLYQGSLRWIGQRMCTGEQDEVLGTTKEKGTTNAVVLFDRIQEWTFGCAGGTQR